MAKYNFPPKLVLFQFAKFTWDLIKLAGNGFVAGDKSVLQRCRNHKLQLDRIVWCFDVNNLGDVIICYGICLWTPHSNDAILLTWKYLDNLWKERWDNECIASIVYVVVGGVWPKRTSNWKLTKTKDMHAFGQRVYK